MTKTTKTDKVATPAPAATETIAGGLGLLITPLRAAAPAEGGAVDVLVRVQAPEQPASEGGEARPRIPLRLALVVDRSGSMDGAPLAEALRCVQHIGADSIGFRWQRNLKMSVARGD